MEYTKFTSEQFKTYTGKLLDSRVPGDDDENTKVERFIDRCVEDIQEYIIGHDFGYVKFDDLTETQNDLINKAAMMQADWILENSDFRNLSGYDAVTGGFSSLADIEKRHIAPKAKRLLDSRVVCRSF